jgi:hypothetical protein
MGNAPVGLRPRKRNDRVSVRGDGGRMIEQKSGDLGIGGDAVEFRYAGERVKGDFRCADCGYGVAVFTNLPSCPMCQGAAWEESLWSPFGRTAGRLL